MMAAGFQRDVERRLTLAHALQNKFDLRLGIEQVGYVVSGEIDVVMEGHKPIRLAAGGSMTCSRLVVDNVAHSGRPGQAVMTARPMAA